MSPKYLRRVPLFSASELQYVDLTLYFAPSLFVLNIVHSSHCHTSSHFFFHNIFPVLIQLCPR